MPREVVSFQVYAKSLEPITLTFQCHSAHMAKKIQGVFFQSGFRHITRKVIEPVDMTGHHADIAEPKS